MIKKNKKKNIFNIKTLTSDFIFINDIKYEKSQ